MKLSQGPQSIRLVAAMFAVGLALGAIGIGGFSLASAQVSSNERPVFVSITPCRLVDTRPSAKVGPDQTLTLTAHGSNGECTGASAIPTDAVALSLNVTALGATERTFLTLWGDGDNPGTSNLNPIPGQPPTPNAVNTPLSGVGTFNLFNAFGEIHVIADVNGYYADHDHDDRYVQPNALDEYATLLDLDEYATLESLAALGDLSVLAIGTVEFNAPSTVNVSGFNAPDGVTASIARSAEGRYVLQLSGVSGPIDGVTQVTAFSDSLDGVRACSLGATTSTATSYSVAIDCFGRDGDPATDITLRDASFQFTMTG